jgi:competence protein ComEC
VTRWLPRDPAQPLDRALEHPRHLPLAALVAGLLAGPRSSAAVIALAAAPLAALIAVRELAARAGALSAGRCAERPAASLSACGLAGRRGAAPAAARTSASLARRGLAAIAAAFFARRCARLAAALAARACVAAPPLAARAAGPLAAGLAVAVLLGAVVARERLRALDATALRPAASFTVRGFAVEPARSRAFGAEVVPVRLVRGAGAGERVVVRATEGLGGVGTGEEVVARGELRALREFESFERRRGVHAVLEAERVEVTGARRRSVLDDVRRRAERALGAGLPREQAALARGMVLGQDHALPDDLRDAFRTAGLAHLVAASGQNVMLLAALVIAVATAAGAMLRTRLALALAVVALYVPLAGAGPSIQRAGVMGAAGLVAALAGRPASRWYALLLAAAATLVLNPRGAEDPGWQLSFAAVVAILALHRRLRDALVARGSPRGLAEAAALTIAATAGTAPLLALHFEQVSLVSLPVNVLAAPAVAPVMWLGAIAATLGAPLAGLVNALAAPLLAYLAWLGRSAAALPYASIEANLPGPLAAAAIYAAMAAAAVVACRTARAARWRGPPAAAAAIALLVSVALVAERARRPDPPRGFALSVLDVGQGDATLLQHGAHAILVDAGPPGAGIVKQLRAAGVRRLDAILITHTSRDHEGGLGEVLDAMKVGLVLDGRQTEEELGVAEGSPPGGGDAGAATFAGDDAGGATRVAGGEGGGVRFQGLPDGVRRAVPEAGQVIRAGPLALEILWPPPGRARAGDPNGTAAVALARDGRTTALLTADAESPVTLNLDLPDVDVLKVAHHGSKDEGLPALLDRIAPEVAVIPVGRNTYGHPAPSTLAALGETVPKVHRTDRDGTVRIGAVAE